MTDETTDVKKREESLRTLQKRMESREATRQKLLAELQKLKDDDVADVKAFNIKFRKKRTHLFCSLCPGLLVALGVPKEDNSLEWLQTTNDDVQYFVDNVLHDQYYLDKLRECYNAILAKRTAQNTHEKNLALNVVKINTTTP
ncbi:MAG: hypothetical protein ACI3XC_03125 [Phascolarctobacterium sp.]